MRDAAIPAPRIRIELKKFDGDESVDGREPIETVIVEYDERGRLVHKEVIKHATDERRPRPD